MLSAIKLVISENGKLLQTVSKDTTTQPKSLIISLQEFQQSANDALTRLIDDNNSTVTVQSSEESAEEDDDDVEVSPRKRKK